MTIAQRGIVATSQTLASQAGAQVLARGGSAMDAAIAANAVLGVVEPMSCGIGGDLFALYWDAKTGKLTGMNASGWSPRALTLDRLRANHSRMPEEGIDSVTVPGCVDGWHKLHRRFGKLPWADLFQPAIFYARKGFPVTELIARSWALSIGKLRADDNARRVLLVNENAPQTGDIFRNPELARAMRLIAAQGPAAFYRGAIAKAIVRTSDRLRGALDSADLAEFSAEWTDPISTDYRGWKVYELPPNGQGVAALAMLNIMEKFELPAMDHSSPLAWHLKIEAKKLAYEDLRKYVGDPRFGRIPLAGMLSKQYAESRARLIDRDKAQCGFQPGDPLPATGDTIYLSVVDKDGNIASLIQSVYLDFGTGIVVDGFGFPLHNRGGLFSLEPGHANVLAPRKRPFHTIIPAFMQKGSMHVGFGIMGGLNQAQAHAQFVSNVVDHEMNIQQALEAPRFTKKTFDGCDLEIENRVPERTLEDLSRRGHRLDVVGAYAATVGGGQAVMHDAKTGVNYGASSPRKDGSAIPEPDRYFDPPGAATARKKR